MKPRFVRVCDIDTSGPNVSRGALGDVSDLRDAIRRSGWVCPVLCLRSEGRLQLIAGYRRVAAVKELQREDRRRWELIPAQILEADTDRERALLNVSENFCRRTPDLPAFARAIQQLRDEGADLKEIAKASGRSVPHCSTVMAVFADLAPAVKAALDSGVPVPFRRLQKWRYLDHDEQGRQLESFLSQAHEKEGDEQEAHERTEAPPTTPGAYLARLRRSKDERHRYAASVLAWALGRGRRPPID